MKKIRDIIKNIAVFLIRNIIKVMWIFKIKDERIFCSSFLGAQYSCNPKYIAEYLLEKYPDSFEIIFEIKNPKSMDQNQIKFVKSLSITMIYYFCTSKVIISNGGMPSYLPKRKNQYVINTWHGGGAYKRCPLDGRHLIDRYKRRCTDLVLSSSGKFSELGVPDIVPGYAGEIMPCGMPRNDLLFSGNMKEIKRKVHKLLNIPSEKKILLYAPTFRGTINVLKNVADTAWLESSLDIDAVCQAVKERFQDDFVFVFRIHHRLTGSNIPKRYVDATKYPDMQELLCAADVLISDYSSTIWDFSLMKKPCFLYVPDMEEYLNNDRGVYMPITEWPGIMCRSNEELRKAIHEFDEEGYVQKIEKNHRDMESYENGTACEQVCRRIAEVCGKIAS